MSNNQGDYPPSTLVGAKRVKSGEKDSKGRERVMLTFDAEQTALLAAEFTKYASEGKQVNFDVRVGEAESASGRKFPTAFTIVKEMIPLSQGGGGGAANFKPKANRTDKLKSAADKIRAEVEG